ncbi:hemerythrin-like metal-binding protein [Azospirillum fermentarium]|uniref:bacteriohemerythrin n=1 Tax=Azospirillum fermentarium TaxID=1233114 RepID=UPI002227BF29|nr:bacteriohemerythrin [Azospirillum fermentarium]MCW2247997.1 hemerythrin-like metal-binding protein [Azospirillum fermentarium]
METIGWSDAMVLGVPELDREHQSLVTHFKTLADPALLRDQAAFRGRLDALVAEVCAHFDAEERLMREHHYQDAAEHKDAHDEMLKQINSFLTLLEQEHGHPGVTILDFVGQWLTDHIAEDDRAFAEFLKRNRRQAS